MNLQSNNSYHLSRWLVIFSLVFTGVVVVCQQIHDYCFNPNQSKRSQKKAFNKPER